MPLHFAFLENDNGVAIHICTLLFEDYVAVIKIKDLYVCMFDSLVNPA